MAKNLSCEKNNRAYNFNFWLTLVPNLLPLRQHNCALPNARNAAPSLAEARCYHCPYSWTTPATKASVAPEAAATNGARSGIGRRRGPSRSS